MTQYTNAFAHDTAKFSKQHMELIKCAEITKPTFRSGSFCVACQFCAIISALSSTLL